MSKSMKDTLVTYEPIIYPGVFALLGAVRFFSALLSGQEPLISAAAMVSPVFALALLFFMLKGKPLAFLLCSIYLLINGGMNALAAGISLSSPEMLPVGLGLALYAAFCLLGGVRMGMRWKSMRP